MKIGIDGRLIDLNKNTGISRYSIFIIDYYISIFGQSNIYIITNDKSFQYKSCGIIYTSHKPFNILDFFRYKYFISSLNLDLLHVPFYSSYFGTIKSTKIIVTVHDLMYKLVNSFFGGNKFISYLKVKYFDFIVSNTIKGADITIAVSQTTQKDIYEIYNRKSTLVPEYSSIEVDVDNEILDKHNLSNKSFFLYCGNARPHKNLNFIIDIFNNEENLPKLVLVGSAHKSSKNVYSVGVLSDNELKTMYKNCIAFIFPSLYEGFGLPVLEALSARTRVIASKIPAFLEFKSNNITYFDLGDKNSFLDAIKSTINNEYIEEPLFWENYSKQYIYNCLNNIINNINK